MKSRLEARAMKKDSTGVKLGIAFGFLIALLIGVGWFGLSRMGQVNAEVSRVLNQRWAKVELGRLALSYSNSTFRITTKIVFLKNAGKSGVNLFPVEREENTRRVAEVQAKIEAVVDSDVEKELLAKIDLARRPTNQSLQKLYDLLENRGKTAEANEVMINETFAALEDYRDTWIAFVQFEEAQMNLAREQTQTSYATARQLSTFLILMAIILAVGIAVFVTRKLTAEIHEREHAKIAIRKLNEDLEKKVAERTEELARTVEALKREVRDRRAREEDLRRLAAIVEYSDDAIIGVGLDSLITDWNSGAERMLGYLRSEIIGMPITTIFPPSHRDEPLDNQARLKGGESVVRRESLRLRKDGKTIHVALTVSPIKDQLGRVIGTAGIMRDISERKLIEDALQH